MQPYIVRRAPKNGAKVRHYITDMLHVSQVDETRSTGRTLGGMFREVETTGRKVKGILRIRTGPALDGYGRKGDHGEHVRTTAEEVKKVVRRVRPEESALIVQHDAEIADLEEQLRQARLRRAETVAMAWTKAHVVTLKELEALSEIKRSSSYDLTAEQKAELAAVHDEVRRLFQS